MIPFKTNKVFVTRLCKKSIKIKIRKHGFFKIRTNLFDFNI